MIHVRMILNHNFSYGSNGIDICFDTFFWKHHDVSKSRKDFTTHPLSFSKQNCASSLSHSKGYCPNSANASDCQKRGLFFCQTSKTCIPHGKVCDGIKHCLYADDEIDEVCKDTFNSPEEATISIGFSLVTNLVLKFKLQFHSLSGKQILYQCHN